MKRPSYPKSAEVTSFWVGLFAGLQGNSKRDKGSGSFSPPAERAGIHVLYSVPIFIYVPQIGDSIDDSKDFGSPEDRLRPSV